MANLPLKAVDWHPKGVLGWRGSASKAMLPPVVLASSALLLLTRFGWAPAGTTEPGGWTITYGPDQFRVSPGSYVITDLTTVVDISSADALAMSLAASTALRGDPPSRKVAVKPILLGADSEASAYAVAFAERGVVGEVGGVLAAIARLGWLGGIQIVNPRTLGLGYEIL